MVSGRRCRRNSRGINTVGLWSTEKWVDYSAGDNTRQVDEETRIDILQVLERDDNQM